MRVRRNTTARIVTVLAGAMLTLLGLPWLLAALFIGLSGEPFFLVLLGGYALLLCVTGYKLLRGFGAPLRWSLIGVAAPFVPLLITVLVRLALFQQSPDPGAPDGTEMFVVHSMVAAVSGVAALLNWQSRRQIAVSR